MFRNEIEDFLNEDAIRHPENYAKNEAPGQTSSQETNFVYLSAYEKALQEVFGPEDEIVISSFLNEEKRKNEITKETKEAVNPNQKKDEMTSSKDFFKNLEEELAVPASNPNESKKRKDIGESQQVCVELNKKHKRTKSFENYLMHFVIKPPITNNNKPSIIEVNYGNKAGFSKK